jgi:hypothetical protein
MAYNFNHKLNYMLTKYCDMCKRFNIKFLMNQCKICTAYGCKECYVDNNICKCVKEDYICKPCKRNFKGYIESRNNIDYIASYPCDACYKYYCKRCMYTGLYCYNCCSEL